MNGTGPLIRVSVPVQDSQKPEKDGQYTLQTNVYEVLGNYTTSIIDSDVLGEAFEPEERFENPDGSTIIFDRDYFGNHRSLKAVPGPFATAEVATWNL